jgi:PAS domain S-box-containing protein
MRLTAADSTRLLRLEHAVARLLAEAGGTESFRLPLLEAVGSTLDWDHAAIWQPTEDGCLTCEASWTPAGRDDLAAFERLSRELRLRSGEGLPGRVWRTREPAWIDDVTRDPNFPRADAAATAGLHAALCFPVVGEDDAPIAVIEVMRSTMQEPDLDLLATLESLGRQVGRFVGHRAAEQAVRENEARLQATLDAALDAIITLDHRGQVVAFNPAAEEMFGYPASWVVGREMAELIVPPALRDRHREGFARYLETGQPTVLGRRIEVSGMRADGSEFPIELTITRIPLGGPALFTGHLRDITERTEMIEELRASRARLVAAADEARRRLERDLHDGAQQRLVAIAVDLRLAREELAAGRSDEALELLDEVETELLQATGDLRELARGLHPGVLSRHGLEVALRALADRAPVPVTVDVDLDERPRQQIEAAAYFVVAEALTNAARYAEAASAEVAVSANPQAGTVVVSISDDGKGGASLGAGTGLIGLRDRVAALGGELEVSSPPGHGTVVHAELPAGT